MTADLASLLAAGIPRPLFYAWSAVVMAICMAGHLRILRRYRRFVRETETKLRLLEQRSDEHEARIDAEVARMRAELDAYGAWSEANDRFFHHGLVAVSHLLGARALPARRACISERRSTHERRATPTTWRPTPSRAANPVSSIASSTDSAMGIQRRTCS
ncbi:MAG: hypothetical protein OXM54_14600 [Acidimicrobiaceae bacterium]|nr:hypothetical protein [Acidimicrobiaceae bacterium]